MRVGHVNGEYVLYPTYSDLKESDLDLVVSSTRERVIMVEAGANGVSEEIFLEAVKLAHEANQKLIQVQDELVKELGKPKMQLRSEVHQP